jgi:hypothetical protein
MIYFRFRRLLAFGQGVKITYNALFLYRKYRYNIKYIIFAAEF